MSTLARDAPVLPTLECTPALHSLFQVLDSRPTVHEEFETLRVNHHVVTFLKQSSVELEELPEKEEDPRSLELTDDGHSGMYSMHDILKASRLLAALCLVQSKGCSELQRCCRHIEDLLDESRHPLWSPHWSSLVNHAIDGSDRNLFLTPAVTFHFMHRWTGWEYLLQVYSLATRSSYKLGKATWHDIEYYMALQVLNDVHQDLLQDLLQDKVKELFKEDEKE